MNDWRKQIGIAHLVKQRVAELDVQGLWPFHLPEVAASEEQVLQVERVLGESLDPKYRAFLKYANGWLGFLHAIDLFGTDDLAGGERRRRADELLVSLEELQEVCGLQASEVLPIAVSQDGIDVFVMGRPGSQKAGEVFWLAGQLVDTFPDFDEFFLAMVDYNREEAQALEQS